MPDNPVRRRFRLATWPSVDDATKAIPFSDLHLTQSLQNSIGRAFSGDHRILPSTVGELLEISPDMLILRARPRKIGEGSVKELLAALATHGVRPHYP